VGRGESSGVSDIEVPVPVGPHELSVGETVASVGADPTYRLGPGSAATAVSAAFGQVVDASMIAGVVTLNEPFVVERGPALESVAARGRRHDGRPAGGVHYLPVMQELFRTRPLSRDSWARIALVGATVGIVVGAGKTIRRRAGGGRTRAGAASRSTEEGNR
jgi:hypothetical protein